MPAIVEASEQLVVAVALGFRTAFWHVTVRPEGVAPSERTTVPLKLNVLFTLTVITELVCPTFRLAAKEVRVKSPTCTTVLDVWSACPDVAFPLMTTR